MYEFYYTAHGLIRGTFYLVNRLDFLHPHPFFRQRLTRYLYLVRIRGECLLFRIFHMLKYYNYYIFKIFFYCFGRYVSFNELGSLDFIKKAARGRLSKSTVLCRTVRSILSLRTSGPIRSGNFLPSCPDFIVQFLRKSPFGDQISILLPPVRLRCSNNSRIDSLRT